MTQIRPHSEAPPRQGSPASRVRLSNSLACSPLCVGTGSRPRCPGQPKRSASGAEGGSLVERCERAGEREPSDLVRDAL